MEREKILRVIDSLRAQIEVLDGKINLKIDKNDVVNQINISDEEVKISANKIEL